MMLSLSFYKMNPDVQDPTYGTSMSACFDLRFCPTDKNVVKGYDVWNYPCERFLSATKDLSIYPGDRLMLPTGLIFKLEYNSAREDIMKRYSIRVHARSGLSLKRGLALVNAEGVIDLDYQKEVFVLMTNNSNAVVDIEFNERIAQAEVVRNEEIFMHQLYHAPEAHGERTGGFGSTGTV
jgi:dUTP pyrophosphatase